MLVCSSRECHDAVGRSFPPPWHTPDPYYCIVSRLSSLPCLHTILVAHSGSAICLCGDCPWVLLLRRGVYTRGVDCMRCCTRGLGGKPSRARRAAFVRAIFWRACVRASSLLSVPPMHVCCLCHPCPNPRMHALYAYTIHGLFALFELYMWHLSSPTLHAHRVIITLMFV